MHPHEGVAAVGCSDGYGGARVRMGDQGCGRARLVGDPRVRGFDGRQAREGAHRAREAQRDRGRLRERPDPVGSGRGRRRPGAGHLRCGDRQRVASEDAPRARAHAPDHHQRPGAVVRPHPGFGGRDRRGRRRLGVRVAVPLVRSGGHPARGSPRLAPLEDDEVSKEIGRAFRRRGITAVAGAAVKEVTDTGDAVQVIYEADGASHGVTADLCLVAVGREPVTDGLGLQEAGVALTDRGYVRVDELLRTTAPGVSAVGDVAATPLQLAHVAFTEGIATAERLAGIDVPPIEYANIPRVTYCTPEIASVGLTETQARETGRSLVTEKLDLRAIGTANIVGAGGFVKVVAEEGGGPVLGVHMIGPHVTDLIAEAMLITSWEATPADVAALIHPHPTLSEGLGEAMLALAGKALHSA